MAEEQDNRTQDQIKEAQIEYSDDDVQKAIQLLKDQGYVTKKDFKKMSDDVWAHGFERKIDSVVQDDDEYNPYLYVERFDFKSGNIDSIIFDMDKVKTRQDALETLADVTKQKVIR